MVSILEAILLGIIQGITEWLPISSSAHLALTQHFFNIGGGVAFDVALHFGTLLAVVAYYRNDLAALARGMLKKDEKQVKLLVLLLISLIPTAVIGFAFKDFFESLFEKPQIIAVELILTGIFLMLAGKRKNNTKTMGKKSAFLVGIAQGISVAPGISRSGATIGTALLAGIKQEEAARFSFLAGIIPILGASLIEGKEVLKTDIELSAVIVGIATSAIVGYLSIGFLLKTLRESKFQWFGYYCIVLAGIVLVATM